MPGPVTPKTLIVYIDEYGNEPYVDWVNNLKDKMARKRIQSRLLRLEAGLYGDCEPVGEGVSELRMFFGPGSGSTLVKTTIILLFCFVVVISPLRNRILKPQKPIGRSTKTMAKKRNYRTLSQIDEEYYRNHPEEIGDFLTVAFEDYAKDGSTAALLSQLRMIARVKGISAIAEETGISRNGIQKALSEQGNPKFESINAIIHAMGYQLVPQKYDNYAR